MPFSTGPNLAKQKDGLPLWDRGIGTRTHTIADNLKSQHWVNNDVFLSLSGGPNAENI